MNGIEELVKAIRREGAHDNLPGIVLGEVQANGNVLIRELELDITEDCMKPVNMTFAKGDVLAMYQYSDDCYLILQKLVKS